jgi:uncharacterized Zn-finger protein
MRKEGLIAPTDHFCELCGKAISSKHALKIHIKTVHERKSLEVKCPHCDEVFINNSSKRAHVNLVHFPDA